MRFRTLYIYLYWVFNIVGMQFMAVSAKAQTSYIVDDFSEEYYINVTVEPVAEGSEVGAVRFHIVDKLPQKALTTFSADWDSLYIAQNLPKAEGMSVPYHEQSWFLYEDFNFDGEKDLAILDGFHSCEGAPTYQVYLAAENDFEWNEGFSELGQFYCGMFKVNPETKTLETLAKSGCCLYEHSKFMVKDNQPYLIKQLVEDNKGRTK